jgi:Bacterial HORMA domain 2
MLGSIRDIIKGSGLNASQMREQWDVLECGIAAWLASGHLKAVIPEVYDPRKHSDGLVGRFGFTIDYGYYPGGDGDLWLDPETVAHGIRKNGSFPAGCEYRIVADCTPGYPAVAGWQVTTYRPAVAGWQVTTYRSTTGFTRHTVGTTIGGGSLGAGLAYYTRSSS